MPKKKATETAAGTTPKDVQSKWDEQDAPVGLRVKRAASSRAWYRRKLKGELPAGTRKTYEKQAKRYEALIAQLRAERDAAKASPASVEES